MKPVVLALMFYFALVTGGLLPVVELGLPYLLARVVVLAGTCLALAVQPPSARIVAMLGRFALISGIIVLSFSFDVSDVTYALKKADGIIFGTFSAAIILYALVRRSSLMAAFNHILIAGGIVLGMTIIYKALYGFWDRETVFLMNGPIVFGWLMGMLMLMSCFLFLNTNRRLYLACALVFLSAVLWTESKGPLVALALSTIVLLLVTAVESPKARYISGVIIGSAAIFFISGGVDTSSLNDTRFGALARIATNQLEESDAGSVDSRAEMLQQGIALIIEHPFTGTGFGGWQEATNSEHAYPHNVLLEIFVEFGVIVGIVVVGALITSVLKVPMQIRLLALFFVICNSLSGDAGYLRFPLCFIFVAHAMRERREHA